MSTLLKNTVRIFALLALVIGATATRADDDDGNIFDRLLNRSTSASFAGTWDTMTVNGNRRTLRLRQIGNNVTGSYSPDNGKVEGKVKDGVLRLQWRQDGAKGSARFALSPDRQIFSGTFNNTDDPDAFGFWWNGVRQSKLSFEGTWNLASSDKVNYTVVLQRKGDRIIGTFHPGNGVIRDGRVRDGRLAFKYTKEYFDGPARGEGVFNMSDDRQSLSGNLNEVEGPQKGKATITATRAPVSFNGTWTWKSVENGNDIYMKQISFKQVGDRVNPGDDGGTVIGNTLFFDWDATGLHHNAILVMDEDGKSFRGMFNQGGDKGGRNIATVGNLVNAAPLGK